VTAVVVDASAFVEFLLRTGRHAPFDAVIMDPASLLEAPALCDVEVLSALRRGVASGALEPGRAEEAIEDYRALPVRRHGHLAMLPRMFELRERFGAYAAAYVVLAERLRAPLLTGDARLAHAVRDSLGVEVLPEPR
jgi:predicted nucleic acid-binding protein